MKKISIGAQIHDIPEKCLIKLQKLENILAKANTDKTIIIAKTNFNNELRKIEKKYPPNNWIDKFFDYF